MKNCDRRAVEIASKEASSAQVPQKSKFRLSRKFLFFTASALIFGASLCLTQSVKAEGALTVAGIQSVLQGEPQALKSQQTTQASQQDEAVSALSSFAQQIGTPAAQADRQFNDQALASLQDFAQRLGTAQPRSIKDLPKVAAVKRSSASVDAHFVGAKACLTCHAKSVAEFEKTLMGKIGKTQKGKFECENCHGPGSAHVKAGGGRGVGGILSFGKDDPRSVEEKNGVCLACHQKGGRNYWAGSVHETRGVACTNCHTVMKDVSRKRNLKTSVEAETCYQCHQLKRAQMQYSSHMPVREGKLTCSNCHNPHGSITEKLIREASVNDNCYKCHAEKRGPLLWEHAPVRENCLNCHSPHGSNYENLLKVARPRICHECHSFAHGTGGFGTPTTAYVLGKACGNCHSNIHGSNHPAGMFFLR